MTDNEGIMPTLPNSGDEVQLGDQITSVGVATGMIGTDEGFNHVVVLGINKEDGTQFMGWFTADNIDDVLSTISGAKEAIEIERAFAELEDLDTMIGIIDPDEEGRHYDDDTAGATPAPHPEEA